MLNCYHKFFLLNGQVMHAGQFTPALFDRGVSIYEVFRVIENKPLFLREHLNRLNKSVNLTGFDLWTRHEQIVNDIQQLITLNSVESGNVELIFNLFGGEKKFIALFIEDRYPSSKQYTDGIDVICFPAEREKPNVKLINLQLRKMTVKAISENNIHEVLLVNDHGLITEGSRTNVFFIGHDGNIYTPPVEQVLKGITRDKVYEICELQNIRINECNITMEDPGKFSSAFLTGTSPKVLPVRRIEGFRFDPANPVLRMIMEEFGILVKKDLLNFTYDNIDKVLMTDS